MSYLIPFYGGKHPDMFEIERRCMDRQGKVIAYLDQLLPHGLVLDIGAGNGFTAAKLSNETRQIIPMEPDPRMIDRAQPLAWAKGFAQDIPFHDQTFDGVYATWAFFFNGIPDLEQGIQEAKRVGKRGGLLVIVDNAGDDELTAFATNDITSNRAWWRSQGFSETIISTAFEFDSLDEANKLLSFYFGESIYQTNQKTSIDYNVVAYALQL